MSFDEDPNDQANISGADFAIMCNELADLRRQLAESQARLAELEGQEPVAHQFRCEDGTWHGFIDERHYINTVEDGSWPIRALYAHPAHSPADQKDAARWMPIETAPKGGSEILVCTKEIGQMVVAWHDGYWREKANFLGLKNTPTHWMPLPAAPDAAMLAASPGGQDSTAKKIMKGWGW